jgi:hypothetical protein
VENNRWGLPPDDPRIEQLDALKERVVKGGYISVGEGWYDLILDLDSKLRRLIPDYTVVQIKEKLGGLCWYFGNSEHDVKMQALVGDYEWMASFTCEVTGRPGRLCIADGYWYKTLCEEMALEKGYVPLNDR